MNLSIKCSFKDDRGTDYATALLCHNLCNKIYSTNEFWALSPTVTRYWPKQNFSSSTRTLCLNWLSLVDWSLPWLAQVFCHQQHITANWTGNGNICLFHVISKSRKSWQLYILWVKAYTRVLKEGSVCSDLSIDADCAPLESPKCTKPSAASAMTSACTVRFVEIESKLAEMQTVKSWPKLIFVERKLHD